MEWNRKVWGRESDIRIERESKWQKKRKTRIKARCSHIETVKHFPSVKFCVRTIERSLL